MAKTKNKPGTAPATINPPPAPPAPAPKPWKGECQALELGHAACGCPKCEDGRRCPG